MKNQLYFLFLIFSDGLLAQPGHMLKLGGTVLPDKAAAMAYEWRLNRKVSLEISTQHCVHQTQPDWIFHGDQIVQYLERKIDKYDEGGILAESSGWFYADGKPLPAAAKNFPIYSRHFGLGWRFNFEKSLSPWRFFLQPGLGVSGLRYFEVTDRYRIELDFFDYWEEGVFPKRKLVEQHTVVYEQARKMRQQEKWWAALTYDLGVARRLGRHFFLEGRIHAGFNLETPYKEPSPPARLRNLWLQPLLLAGWRF